MSAYVKPGRIGLTAEPAAVGGDRLFGVLITFRRPDELATSLRRLAEQQRPLDLLVVVDNSPTPHAALLVERYRAGGLPAQYVAAPENLGPAGAVALAMERLLASAADDDWIVLLDDGEPPSVPSELAELLRFATRMRRQDPRLGAVGQVGARFDWRRGRLVRITDQQLNGPVAIDYIGSGQFPLYRVRAVRAVGPFKAQLFFGFEELEYGLRLRAGGWSLYADGDRWRERRAVQDRLGVDGRPSRRLAEATWRRYYGLRNLIHILLAAKRPGAAVRVTLLVGLAKPLANAPRHPGRALHHLRLNWRACRDGWGRRLGRTVEPDDPAGRPSGEPLTGVPGAT
jgi:glycosyltransferase involved in cell wall biosynthesis